MDHDEPHRYQKILIDKLPTIKQNWLLWNRHYLLRCGRVVKPVKTQKGKTRSVPEDTICPLCDAPHKYIYNNTSDRGQFKYKIYGQTFVNGGK